MFSWGVVPYRCASLLLTLLFALSHKLATINTAQGASSEAKFSVATAASSAPRFVSPRTEAPMSSGNQRHSPPLPSPNVVPPSDTTSTSAGCHLRRGRKTVFSTDDDTSLLREILSTGAHVARYGCKKNKFLAVAEALNSRKSMPKSMTWKNAQDRYELLQRQFNSMDNKDRALSGVGGDVTECDEMLSMMREARQESDIACKRERETLSLREKRKLEAGARAVGMATTRKNCWDDIGIEVTNGATKTVVETNSDELGNVFETVPDNASGDVASDVIDRVHQPIDDTDDCGIAHTPTKRRRRLSTHSTQFQGEVEKFAHALKESDTAQLALEKERIDLETLKHEDEQQLRKDDRDERRMEREARRREYDLEREERINGLSVEREVRKLELESRERLEAERMKMLLEALLKKSN